MIQPSFNSLQHVIVQTSYVVISSKVKMVKPTAVVLALLATGAGAFAPASSVLRYPTKMQSSLEVVEDEAAEADPYDGYETNFKQKKVATRDIKVGSGYTVGESEGQLLKIKYTAKLMDSKFTADLKAFNVDDMVFKTGQQRCLPGLEEGIQGMKLGGVRKVRVPPNKGYGDQWYRGIVPPNSHLEFEAELIDIAQNPAEEFKLKLEAFGYDRAAGSFLCLAYLAVSPFIGNGGFAN